MEKMVPVVYISLAKTDNSHFLCTCCTEYKNNQKQGNYGQIFLLMINDLNLILSPHFFEFFDVSSQNINMTKINGAITL